MKPPEHGVRIRKARTTSPVTLIQFRPVRVGEGPLQRERWDSVKPPSDADIETTGGSFAAFSSLEVGEANSGNEWRCPSHGASPLRFYRGSQMERVRRVRKAPPCREREAGAGHLGPRPELHDVAARYAERDAREVLDGRTPAEKWLGDPRSWESARAHSKPTEEDAAAAGLFAFIVTDLLRRAVAKD